MTMNSNALLERILNFLAAGGEIDERADTLLLRGRFADAATQAWWLTAAKELAAAHLPTQIYNLGISDDLTDGDTFDPAREVSITIRKPDVQGVTCFFLQAQLKSYFENTEVTPLLQVADLSLPEAFSARGLMVSPWDIAQLPLPQGAATRINPTRYVRDFVPTREVPRDLTPWILLSFPARPAAAFEAWRTVAARRLMAGLVSSAFEENDVIWLQASGPPLYRLRADDAAIVAAFDTLTAAAQWVFLAGQDIEARHIIFASELARASRMDQTLTEITAKGLESAKASYEAHVQSSSRETLKALGELRKTVIDETQKVTQKTQDLTATLWRDLAVTVTPFVLKLLGDAGKITNARIAAGFYFAAAFFIVLSFTLQWRINGAFFKSQSDSRRTWLLTLYNYISVQERNEIAEKPIETALANYRQTRAVLTFLYVILFGILVSFGCLTLNGLEPAKAGSAPTQAVVPHAPGAGAKSLSAKCAKSARTPCAGQKD